MAAFEKANGPLLVHLDEVLKKMNVEREAYRGKSFTHSLLRKIYIWFKYSKISEERVVTPNNLVIFVENFQIGINF